MNRSRHFTSGVVFVVLFVGLVGLTVAQYNQSFRSTKLVTVETDRAGLTMAKGAVVKLRGVEIGRVSAVRPTSNGAEVDLAIDSSKVDWVSKKATAQIVPPTAFGAKYVQLKSPRPAEPDVITAGSRIRSDAVTVEVNEAFSSLASVLSAARPDKVNNTITALSETLEDRGTEIGELVTEADTYLETFNQSLPELERDLKKADDVLDIYDGLAPDLIALTENLTTTSRTFTDRQKALNNLARKLDSSSKNGEDFIDDNDVQVNNLLETLDPVTQMLQRYSPTLPCILSGVVDNDKMAVEAIGGKLPGINTYTKLQPSDDPYTAPSGLPTAIRDRGPDCFGLPNISQADAEAKNPDFGTGANPYANPKAPGDELSTTFFGVLAGLVNFG